METGSELPSNQLESFYAKGEGIATKRKQKEQFLSEFLTMEATNTWKIYAGDNNQMYQLPRECWWLQQKSFFLLQEKKRETQHKAEK